MLPVLNEERDLGSLLDQLREQEAPPGGIEVLVVDGGSTDATREIVRERMRSWPPLRLLDNPRRRSGPARNVGARAARGEYVYFLDGHCRLPAPGYLVRVVEIFESVGADALCRPQPLEEWEEAPWARAVGRARSSPLGHNPGSDIYRDEPGFTRPESAGAAYRMEVIRTLGGYDERFDACEDVEFNHRVHRHGFRSYRHPDLAVHYRPRDTLGGLFRQMIRYGRGRAHLAIKHPRMVPGVLAGLTVSVLVLVVALRLGLSGWVPLVLAGLYALVCAGEALRVSGDRAEAWRVALAFPAIHLGLLLGFWRGLTETLYFISRPEPRSGSEKPVVG